MWLLDPECTWWFSRDKTTRFRLRQTTLAEGQYMQAQKMEVEERLEFMLSVGIVGAEGLLDHQGKPVDLAALMVPRGDVVTPRDKILPASFVRRIPNQWKQEMVAQIAMGPTQEQDAGN